MSWTPNRPIPDQRSKSSPALAEYAGLLHMVHPGESSNNIWHSWYDGSAWAPNQRILDQQSKAPSAIASYEGRLHLVHLGNSENQLWHSSFDGTRWTTNAKIEGEKAHSAPALAEYGGLLHLVHNGDSSNRLYHLTFDGQTWTKRPTDPALDGQRSKGAPALAAYGGLLHLVHQGDTSNHLWHSSFDGIAWTPNVEIPAQLSKSPPALAAVGGLLQLVHLGDSRNSIWHSTFDGATWAPNIKIPHQLAFSAPALASYRGRLHMVHTGDSEATLWHSDSDGVLVNRPTRRVIVVDLDGVRWDSFQRHLKRVRDAGASTDLTYRFELAPGASSDTVLGNGGVELHSALAELCFGGDNGLVDVRLALSSYPTFTFPSHATMYTGTWPGRHGLAGHKFVVRDAAPEWDWHRWDALPRAVSLQGFCTDAEGSWGAFWDYVWGGFDQVSEDACRNRNRGLNSDLRVPTMFRRVEDTGKRSCAIQAFYHGAERPWDDYGKDQWWHYDASELRSVKDICSDEDIDQLEVADHGAFAKAELLLKYMPSTITVVPPDPNLGRSVGRAFARRDGIPLPGWRIGGEPHPDGAPDLIALYAASVDESSHHDGLRNQETYLAWFDHRLARFVRELRASDPGVFNNTIFAFVADHGHSPVTNPLPTSGLNPDNVVLVRAELLVMMFGESALKQVEVLAAQYGLSLSSLLNDLIKDQILAWAEAMNLYVYLRDTERFPVTDVASRLLSIPMNTEPYGALVLVDGVYQFLARGETRPVPLDSAAARAVVVPRLDPPLVSTAEIDAVALSADDNVRERALREALNSSQVFDLLGVSRRIAGFAPTGHRDSPDIILLAPENRSFTISPSTHGSFAYPTSRIPMVFCGPGMPPGRATLETADLVDFAPTVLTLLGVPTQGMDGRSLLDVDGRVPPIILLQDSPPPPPSPVSATRHVVVRDKTLLPDARVLLAAGKVRSARVAETSSSLPAYAAVRVVRRTHRARGAAQPRVTVDPARWVRIAEAQLHANAATRLWVEDGHHDRRSLGRCRTLDLPEQGSLFVGSAASIGTIEVPSICLVVPVTITLSQVPDWLQDLLRALRHHTPVALGEPWMRNRILLSSDDVTAAVHGLRSQLDPDEPRASVSPPTRPGIPHAAIQAAVIKLKDLVGASTVTRYTLGNPRGLVG